jgi:hypothetical protein
MDRVCSKHGEKWTLYRNSVGKLEGKIPLGRPTRRREDNINIDLTETEWDSMGWVHLACDRGQCPALTNNPSG